MTRAGSRSNGVRLRVIGGTLPSVKTHLDEYTEWLRSWSASPRTISARVSVLRTAIRDAWGDPATVERDDLERWLANPRFQPWTRLTYFSHARSFFGWLHETGRIESNPAANLRRPSQPKGKPRPLSPEEKAATLARANGDLLAWLLLANLAGLRLHEIAKIRGEDVTAEAIYVLGKGGQHALLPTHPDLWELAQSYPRKGFWFPSPRTASGHIAPTTLTTKVSRFFDELGIDGSIHRCRHSYGTDLLRGGANIRVVQTLLRHAQLTTTQIYTEVDEDERAAAVRVLRGVAA